MARQLSPRSGYARLDGVLVRMIVLKRHNRDYPLGLIPSPGQISQSTTASTYYLELGNNVAWH